MFPKRARGKTNLSSSSASSASIRAIDDLGLLRDLSCDPEPDHQGDPYDQEKYADLAIWPFFVLLMLIEQTESNAEKQQR